MKTMTQGLIVFLSLLGVGGGIGLVAVSSDRAMSGEAKDLTGTVSQSVSDDPEITPEQIEAIWQGSRQEAIEHAAWVLAERETFLSYGMEAFSAGFHLLRPPTDVAFFQSWVSTRASSARYEFWNLVEKAYPAASYLVVMGLEHPTLHISYRRVFANTTLSIARKVLDPDETYRVEIEFGEAGFAALQALHGTSPGVPYIDWYGEERSASQAPTELTAVLVFGNKAYVPLSISDVINQQQTNTPIVVAHGLSDVMADKIVDHLTGG